MKVICSPPTFVFAQRASTSAMDSVDELTIQVRRKVIKKVNRRSDYCVLGNPIRIDRRVLTIILPVTFSLTAVVAGFHAQLVRWVFCNFDKHTPGIYRI